MGQRVNKFQSPDFFEAGAGVVVKGHKLVLQSLAGGIAWGQHDIDFHPLSQVWVRLPHGEALINGTQVVLPLLESDLLTVMQATTNGTLDKTEVKFSDGAAACVILASGGYPLAYEKGKEITGLTEGQLDAADVTVYHAGTAIKEGKLVTNGGRVLGVTATAATLPEALKKAYAASESIHFDKLHKRSDIGARALAAMQ